MANAAESNAEASQSQSGQYQTAQTEAQRTLAQHAREIYDAHRAALEGEVGVAFRRREHP